MAAASLDRDEARLLESPNFCHLVTYGKDGSAHVAVLWVDLEGDRVVLNGAPNRAWSRRLAADGRAHLTIQNQENPYEYVTIVASLAERTAEGAAEQLDRLAKKYLDEDAYPWGSEPRELFYLTPTKVYRYAG